MIAKPLRFCYFVDIEIYCESQGRYIVLIMFLKSMAVGFSGAVMPGSLLTYTMKQSLTASKRSGWIIAAGHAILELLLIVLIFLGFDTVLNSKYAIIVIGILGGALLMYLGIGMIWGAVRNTAKVIIEDGKPQNQNMLLSGFLISAANPYFLVWWTGVGLAFVMKSYTMFGIPGVIVYYLGHICADFIWYGTISTVIGTTKKFINEKAYRVIIGMLGIVLVVFGFYFLFDAAIMLPYRFA